MGEVKGKVRGRIAYDEKGSMGQKVSRYRNVSNKERKMKNTVWNR